MDILYFNNLLLSVGHESVVTRAIFTHGQSRHLSWEHVAKGLAGTNTDQVIYYIGHNLYITYVYNIYGPI